MFDTKKEIEVQFFSGGQRKCIVRWPEDKEWKKRAARIRMRLETISQERTKSLVLGVESSAQEMLAAIRRDTGEAAEEFDGAEAAEIINQLEFVDLDTSDGGRGVNVGQDSITVRLSALRHRGKARIHGLVHTLRMPRMRHVMDWRNANTDYSRVRRGVESVQSLDAGERFYDALIVSSEGYPNGVPVTHKDFVAFRVIEAYRELEEGPEDPEA